MKISKEECKQALTIFCEQNTFKDISKDVLEENYQVLKQLIEEHFELVEEYRKLKNALDNAIKQCCIGVTGSDACSSLDELYKAFEEKVWEDVE